MSDNLPRSLHEEGNEVHSPPQERPFWRSGEALVLGLFTALALSFVVLLPSFEGPDESEHVRYAQAWAEGGDVHPVDPSDPLRWGYQIHHPPLYYAIAGTIAGLLNLTFHENLVINAAQNSRFPFLRHDSSGQKFPYDPVHRGLHQLRLVSVLFGVLTYGVLAWGFREIFPDQPSTRALLLGTAMLAPNSLQIFSVVANDGLNMLFGVALLFTAIWILRQAEPGPRAFLVAGILAGLAVISKLTALAALGVTGSLWALDGVLNRRVGIYVRGMLTFLPAVLLLAGPFFVTNILWYGDPTRESLLMQLTPAFHLAEARPLFTVLEIIHSHLPFQFAADLAWQTIRLRDAGTLLFWPWLLGVGISGAIGLRRGAKDNRVAVERLAPIVALLWSLILLVAANLEWTNLQIRHVWFLFPFSLIGVAHTLELLPQEARTWGKMATAAGLAGMLFLNAQVFHLFREFTSNGASGQLNRDYATYLYTQVRDRDRAQQYLRSGR